MKNTFLLLILIACVACQNKNDDEIISLLNQKIDNWHNAASKANFDDYFNFIANDGIFIGTDVSERWTKTEFSNFSQPYFDKGKAWSFSAKERTIRLNKIKTTAWFDEVLDTWMGDCRSTGVLSINNGQWQLEHYQLSVTIDNELMPQFLEITKSE